MNELIKELADLAWTYVSDEERTRGELYEADRQRERRDQVFAQLIVQECMDNLALHGHDEAVSQLEWFKINKLGIK